MLVCWQVTVFVVLGLTLGATANGLGRHFFFVDKAEAAFSVELLRISEFFLIISTVLIKISISLFLKRLLYVLITLEARKFQDADGVSHQPY